MKKVRFRYEPEPGIAAARPKKRSTVHEHEAWAEAILPADRQAPALDEPFSRRPLVGLAAVAVAMLVVLVVRLGMLQLLQGGRNLGLAEGNRLRTTVTTAPRGVLYDRNGQQLVRNEPSFDITAVPQQLPREAKSRQQAYDRLARVAGIDASALRQQAEKPGLTYSQPVLLASQIARDTALKIEQAKAQLPGISVAVSTVRQYLDGGQLSSLLGYTGRISAEEYATDASQGYQPTDYIGKGGIEKQYESLLRGSNGSEQTEVDVTERPVKVLASKPSVAGSNVVLTIDMALQNQLVTDLQKQLDASGSKRAAGVVLNPKNGEILAMASLPSYDNNLFAKGISARDYAGLLGNPDQPLFNKALQGAYPSGSIIKPLVATAALQEKTITTATSVEDKGSIEVPNQYDPKVTYTFRSYEPGGLGVVNLQRAIAVSSNVFFYTIGGGYGAIRGLGVTKLDAWYQRFGLGSRTGIDVPGEASGLVPSPAEKQQATGESWYVGDTYNISVGQGDLRVSPLQMASAIAAIANGGTLYRPHLLQRVTDAGGRTLRETKPEVVRSGVADGEVLATVRDAMRQVVLPGGTACCKIEQEVPVHVAAKTGTAETDPSGNRKPHAWFVSFAPYEDPRLVTVVLIENSGEGAQYAAPATRDLLKWYFTNR